MCHVSASCRWLLTHWTRCAWALALDRAGNNSAASIAIMAMTTSSSTSVNARHGSGRAPTTPLHRSNDWLIAFSPTSIRLYHHVALREKRNRIGPFCPPQLDNHHQADVTQRVPSPRLKATLSPSDGETDVVRGLRKSCRPDWVVPGLVAADVRRRI